MEANWPGICGCRFAITVTMDLWRVESCHGESVAVDG